MVDNNRKLSVAPKHLALIPDGNRRWSKSHRLSLSNGYESGIKKFVDFSIWLRGFGASTVTVWALSTENIKNRSGTELSVLYRLYKKASYDKDIISKLEKNDTKVVVTGELDKIPSGVRKALKHIEQITSKNKSFTINLLIAYGGRDDILHAVKDIVKAKATNKIKQINESIIEKYMISSAIPNPDLIIRTSGEFRTSGFLPWQSSYSELYFSKKYWPDFNIRDLKTAIKDYSYRQRRYGK
jgi:undecaprenyl diphosphate synthase